MSEELQEQIDDLKDHVSSLRVWKARMEEWRTNHEALHATLLRSVHEIRGSMMDKDDKLELKEDLKRIERKAEKSVPFTVSILILVFAILSTVALVWPYFH